MSNATKTLSALFVIVLVITGIYKLTSNDNTSKDLRNPLVKFNTKKLNRITIKNSKVGDLLLVKKSGTWMISKQPGGKVYKAAQRQVKHAIKRINGIMPAFVVTRDKSNFRRYEVDTTGTLVTLISSGNKKLAQIYLGHVQNSGGHGNMVTYVRPVHQNNVYAVNGLVGPTFNTKLNNWRDKQIWVIHQSHIKSFDMITPKNSFTITKVDSVKWMSGKDTLKTFDVNNILNRMLTFRASGFINSVNPNEFGKPLYTIKIHMDNGSVKNIKFKKDPKDSGEYMAIASNYPYVFTEDKAIFNEEVFRSKKSLIKKIKHKKLTRSKKKHK